MDDVRNCGPRDVIVKLSKPGYAVVASKMLTSEGIKLKINLMSRLDKTI